jgi:hypothetical protein
MLVQQSRALYRTSIAKVKRQKENGLISEIARASPLPFVLPEVESDAVDQQQFSE